MGRGLAISRIIFGLAVCGLGLSACASFHHHRKATVADIGAVKRGDNLYDVVFIAGKSDAPDYMRDMTLLQSAQLCQAQGFAFFKASDTQTYTTHAAPAAPSQDSPKLTLQVSCLVAENDAPVTYGVDAVITRVKTSYKLK